MSTINQFRKPEYTGENRCTPCTIANVAIAVVASALAAIVSSVLGAGVCALSLAR